MINLGGPKKFIGWRLKIC